MDEYKLIYKKRKIMRINEIFLSIDGEVNQWHQGRLSTFIRVSGCNCRCLYCDTKYAQDPDSGVDMPVSKIISKVKEIGCPKVTITGGEPLMQEKELKHLVFGLIPMHDISIETNGTIPPPIWSKRINWVMDYKLPSSGEDTKMADSNFMGLSRNDWIKFVVADINDYIKAIDVKKRLQEGGCCAQFAFRPAIEQDSPHEEITTNTRILLKWLKEDKQFDVVLNLQLHKIAGLK